MRTKNIKKALVFTLALGSTATVVSSCTAVKEYQKNRLNDAEMILGNRKIEKTELSFQGYREGASGANSGKSGGGCGCN
ncbi:DUF4266 domain-containing protein [Pedobacter sp. LMG 31464]|uniref:DUF4266 domain-containing protein n=1 Tax=Pedobacter planticolens TaxID=2679964 RepID=A0A923DVD3_9SPHI|nr:DUF4266 domain-containing protein [Pedobacter planticolens]MBB2144619.1 DUF4266 domain-containing protein [Pedobacter planticolens]